ncbi:MAG: 50S ribosomal protein L11 methyltransferase [Alphaproteobacteria bacterium]
MNRDVTDFIKQNTVWTALSLVPEIKMHLAPEITPVWYAHEGWLNATNVEPPYWAFAWAGGQGLTRYILDNPTLFRDKNVIDFGAGGGMAAIAAARAGAKTATAVDIDPMATAASLLNATENGVKIDALCRDITDAPAQADCLVAGDICYTETMSAILLGWLRQQAARGITVYLGDPGRAFFPSEGYEICAEYTVPVAHELEGCTTRVTRVVRLSS